MAKQFLASPSSHELTISAPPLARCHSVNGSISSKFTSFPTSSAGTPQILRSSNGVSVPSVVVAPQGASQPTVPMATVGLDTSMDGEPNIFVTGVDLNQDGIPDFLQTQGKQTQLMIQPMDVKVVDGRSPSQSKVASWSPPRTTLTSVPAAVVPQVPDNSRRPSTPRDQLARVQPPAVESRCPKSHVMNLHVMQHATSTLCAVCNGSIVRGDALKVCQTCEYAVCPRCRAQPPSPRQSITTSSNLGPALVPAPVGPMTSSKCVYVSLHQSGGRFGGKVQRNTLYFRGVHNEHGYWGGKDIYLFAMVKTYFGQEFALSTIPPREDHQNHAIIATTAASPKASLCPPEDLWESEEYYEVFVSMIRPKDWIEGTTSEGKERVRKLLAAMKMHRQNDGKQCISIKDVCRNIEVVKQHLPELLKEFPKIDVDGLGSVTVDQLEEYFGAEDPREYSQAVLDEMWEIFLSSRTDTSKPKNMIDLEDISQNLEYIEKMLPALLDSFPNIDTNHTCTIERDEFDAFFGDADVWLAKRLQGIIGLGSLKERIHKFYWQQRLDRLRRRGGEMVTNDEAIVIMLRGNPGTGKTTIGRLLAGLLYKIGVIETDTFIECQRDELVGDHIGATEKLTAAKLKEAKGGVLFIDEAYRLNSDVFGMEAINGLMKAMTVRGTVMILAGYPKQMEQFVQTNPGLKRRITYEMDFTDYSTDDLAKILVTQIERKGFKTDVPIEDVRELIANSVTQAQRSSFNGGIGEHIVRHAVFHLNDSQIPLVRNAFKSGSPQAREIVPSVVLHYDDLEYGAQNIPNPPPVTNAGPVSATRRRSRLDVPQLDDIIAANAQT